MFDKTKNTIHLDMDGVLADFDKFVFENLGRTFDHQAGPLADKEMWNFLAGVDRLYFQLEPTPYAFELWELAHSIGDVELLTAIPRRTSMPGAEQDKIEWIEKYFGKGFKVKVGPYSRDKWLHAKTNDILVDDRTDNIHDWIHKGKGVGILHKYDDFENTKRQLEIYL